MKIKYYKETDSVYIDLSEKKSAQTIILSDDVNIDMDENGSPVGIDIHQNAKKILDLKSINFENFVNIA